MQTQPMWRQLLEDYAIRARRFADEVTSLRHHVFQASDQLPPEFLEKWSKVVTHGAACRHSQKEIERYLKELGLILPS